MHTGLFNSFFLGGFECSTHRLRSGKRLDVVHSTRHDELASSDYRLLQQHGIRTARDGLRWHLIEQSPGTYDFSSATGMLRAGRDTGMQIIWDLWHYGWPDDIDIFSAAFVDRFTSFAREAAARISEYSEAPLISPINEISFFSWAAGEGGIFNPFAKHRGDEMKRQLVRATIQAVDAMREVNPSVRIFQIDPIINVVPEGSSEADVRNAESYRLSQFAAWDMILGRAEPELGGREDLIDVIGVNYYIHNQFVWDGGMIVPVRSALPPRQRRCCRRSTSGIGGRSSSPRPASRTRPGRRGCATCARKCSRRWRQACRSKASASTRSSIIRAGTTTATATTACSTTPMRPAPRAYQPLAAELSRQQANLAALESGASTVTDINDLDTTALDWAAHVMQERTDEGRT